MNVPGHGLLFAEEGVDPGLDVDGQAGALEAVLFLLRSRPALWRPSHLNLSREKSEYSTWESVLRIKQTL